MKKQKPKFNIITGKTVHDTIFFNPSKTIDIIEQAYIQHFQGRTVNPNSSFLHFPDNPQARIISLPAHISGDKPISGIKWIASYPSNIQHDLPRASAVLLLNDAQTGYPLACLEASIISAARTAASAVLAAYHLKKQKRSISSLGIIGTGVIASYVLEFFTQTGWDIGQIYLYDLEAKYSQNFSAQKQQSGNCKVKIGNSWQEVIENSDVVVLTTTAATPYISDPDILKHKPILLNLSLRDLGVDIIKNSYNLVDDINHVLQANTSLHLAQKERGNHDFINATLPDVLANKKKIVTSKPIVFSPFGMGILDLALGQYIYETALQNGNAIKINNFFFQVDRKLS